MTVEVKHENFNAVAHELKHREKPTWIVNIHRASDGRHLSPQRWLTREPTEEELLAILLDWIHEKAGGKEPDKVFCGTGCGTELVPECNMDTEYQFDNALWIRFDGGYGMFIDPMFDKTPETVICHECAHKLCDDNPWIGALLDPHSSHSHKAPYVDAHPEHWGWDYDSRAERGE